MRKYGWKNWLRTAAKQVLATSLLALVVLTALAFVGVEPLASGKDVIIANVLTVLRSPTTNMGQNEPLPDTLLSSSAKHNLPFDLVLSRVEWEGSANVLVVHLIATPSANTKIGEFYRIRFVSGTTGELLQDGNSFRFLSPEKERSLIVQLPNDIAEELLLTSNSFLFLEMLDLSKKLDIARKQLAKLTAQRVEFYEKWRYDYSAGNSLPSYETTKKVDQGVEDARQKVSNLEGEVASWEKYWQGTREIDGIHIQDILPYLRINLVSKGLE